MAAVGVWATAHGVGYQQKLTKPGHLIDATYWRTEEVHDGKRPRCLLRLWLKSVLTVPESLMTCCDGNH